MRNNYNKEYYKNNKHKWKRDTPEKKARHAQLVKESAERHKESRRKKHDEWTENNYAHSLWLQTRRRAKYNEIYWDLEISDIQIPEICPYLLMPLTSTQGQGVVWSNASVDRIDNSKGYTKDNIEIISRMANSMKQHATKNQLINFAKRILSVYLKEENIPC